MALAPASGLRSAVPEDLPALRRIAAGALRWDADAAELPRLLWPNTDTEFALVSEADGVPVGLMLGSLGREPRDPAGARRGHVDLLAVDIAVRRDGTAQAEYVGFASYGVNRRDWFGPMGTGGELRGLGIGGVLLRRCLREMRELGYRSAQVGRVGPVPFYARTVDAYIERVYWMYRKDR